MKHLIDQIPDSEPLFKAAASEFYSSMEPYLEEAALKQLLEPERIHIFKVNWLDRHGVIQTNTGYRVQHSSALGPYKGGLRFDKSVNLDMMKFLAFEQTLKNALTHLPLGGAKGGSDFDPSDKTKAEINNFIHSFIDQSYSLFGPNKDVPAGDLGVGQEEIALMAKYHQNLTGEFDGTFTGKPISMGGVLGRQEATGYGLIYILMHLLDDLETDLTDKRVVVSGCGNVGLHAAEKVVEMGAILVGISDKQGYLQDEEGLDIAYIKDKRLNEKLSLKEIDGKKFSEGSVFDVPCDIALPCATQNELTSDHLRRLAQQGCMIIAEGANRPLTQEAVDILKELDVYYVPGKAANAGGVAVSGLEMQQNAQKAVFSFEDVDLKLQEIMALIYQEIKEASLVLDNPYHFVKGANYVAYQRILEVYNLQRLV
ncbi:Glu/Leu/Phe/Val dehydrogenase dimerization domain-containing protein [Erysipelothrix urinaevulpis]|uniref:Glu/Leu/Phe/Val dehydrogenase dimerization domain-containing protein n=1 Tax=Erysipelothrix urinaevulpis TaxID=2683717 RepID=UPI00135CE5D4|nr:Glu/Leu/Phe/Val dehydrogenase dimerization domain-containing protein [Erysipelothrix urinaevulpis]